ncbi:exodeoxyribonuclease V subunit gamma [Rubrivivax rivuli]|uniref:RecBCD enzyme subunit RecC n=1 Tax=Rubrivivax rivuli TaxID=1862385 RepID=A0A437RID2_9BURK|nr:exodeoxyribonuclease V subunit gamma [Rubrivivax rivuli]RVU46526.1 exodeoxyribonuclease V subunit gamma [Rubrivivax rivuli]
MPESVSPALTGAALTPGLLVLHGNRLAALAETVFAFLARHPLGPLEEETLLVQSNGMAEWLKMELATAQGLCAATRVELPARFIWRAYRAVLGRAAVPAVSALDKLPLTWRLMRLLPGLAAQPGFEPVAAFLGADDSPARRLQLARRLADLFDQYQVYRGDWLQAWAAGRNTLPRAPAAAADVPADQAWQPALWRALLAELPAEEQAAARPQLQQRFVQALRETGAGPWPGLPRRVVLFGTTHIPQQLLEAVAALSEHVQVLLAVPNPCRYHWADLISGRELLRAARRRAPLRGGTDLAALPLEALHLHGHPLLAAWGRQGRDFVRQLDAFDNAEVARQRFAMSRVDFFDEGPGQTLLQQLQAQIRDLQPLAEARATAVPPAADDRSIVFHVAHGAQREVEVLHDQLLHLLAHPPGGDALQPRDIVVMVPDIETFAPAIRAVFGQHGRGHPRHIPWGLADQRERGRHPLLLALEWLLRAPQQRHSFSELQGLLEVPALARRFGLAPEDLPTLLAWAAGAGARWGLSAAQRAQLGLASCEGFNSWQFALQRLLLGYATGELPPAAERPAGIEPHPEVAGLDAELAGALAEWLGVLQAWWADSGVPRAPEAWAVRARALLQAVFAAQDDEERALLAALDEALGAWLQACEAAGFDEPVALDVLREAWLDALDEPGLTRRFRAGGVTFCTLLPLRAIPFEVVCLLGMNDGDYPRRSLRSDFDLMALPGQARPGDRSRRDDDRQLMLDALLSARRVLYLSWAGRSVRDNQGQPPSVLVGQLQDHLEAVWGEAALKARITEHPLQPFSRRYFEAPALAEGAAAPALFTYAAEWRGAHEGPAEPAAAAAPAAVAPVAPSLAPATLDALAAFLKNPVKAWFRHRLQVQFTERAEAPPDDESFAAAGLDRWQLMDEVLRSAQREAALAAAQGADTAVDAEAVACAVQAELARLQRAGRLPLAGPGRRVQAELQQTLQPMLQHWQALRAAHPQLLPPLPPALPAVVQDDLADGLPAMPGLSDALVGLRASAEPGALPVFIELQASRLVSSKPSKAPPPRADKLLRPWLRCLAAAACGRPVAGIVVGADKVVHLAPPEPAAARQTLQALLAAWADGLSADAPWPTALATGLGLLKSAEAAQAAFEGSAQGRVPAEGREPCLARLFPSYAHLAAHPAHEPASRTLYAALAEAMATQLRIEDLPGGAAGDEAEAAAGDGDE